MANVVVNEVSTKKELRTFIKLPWKIYKEYPNWVPPLIIDQKSIFNIQKNPFFRHSKIQNFLAFKDGEAAGRISAVVDHNYNQFHNEKTALFGFFEASDDKEVGRALFAAAEDWILEQKMEHMLGPANPSTNQIFGLLVDAFDLPPMALMPYNPPYYEDLFLHAGLKKAKDMYAYHMDETIPISDKIKRVTNIIRKKHNITIRSADIKEFDREVELIKTVYNDAWTKNWGFVPFTDEEIEHLGKDIKLIARPELILLAFVEDEIAAFCLSLPNVNQAFKHVKNGRLFPTGLFKLLWYIRKVNQLRVAIMGVRKKYRTMGIDALFYHDTWIRAYEYGYRDNVELSWILEDNYPMLNTIERWGGIRYKTYRVYGKEL
ncbi:Protein YghO [subsurface metagenome]